MMAIAAVAEVVLTSLIIGLLMVVVYLFSLLLDLDVHIKRAWKAFVTDATWRPKTGIDKEIAEEEKEIAELERQKEKMDKLSELRRRKERLFRDLGEEQRMMCTCGREFHSIDNYKEHLTNCFES